MDFQAGIKNITFYENNSITFRYYDPTDLSLITDLQTLGDSLTIENHQLPEFNIKLSRSNSGEMLQLLEAKFMLLGFNSVNLTLLDKIKTSMYGWCMLVEYYDGTTKYYNAPMFSRESSIDPQKEMSYNVIVKSSVSARFDYLTYTAGIPDLPIYRWDSEILTFDSEIYTWDYEV